MKPKLTNGFNSQMVFSVHKFMLSRREEITTTSFALSGIFIPFCSLHNLLCALQNGGKIIADTVI